MTTIETSSQTPTNRLIKVYAQFKINFLYKPDFEDQAELVRLDMPTNFCGPADVRFAYAKGEGHIQLYEVPIEEKALMWLEGEKDDLYMGNYPDDFMPTFEKICSELESAARGAIEYIKFFLGRDEVADEATSRILTFSWSQDGKEYYDLPNRLIGQLSRRNQNPLTYAIRIELQKGIDKKITPFVAMRHLYRAIQERNPRFKWIDATIAAELAVKEALIRAEPKLTALIVNVPSPPLNKLYGELLEHYLGARSPYINKIQNGATMRNKLIHQPLEVKVSEEDAQDYVNEIMQAIHHLYGLLYPDWSVVKDLSTLRRFWC